jgi:hypothetical protein
MWFQRRKRFTDCMRTGLPAIDLTAPEAEDSRVLYVILFLIRWQGLSEVMRSQCMVADVRVQAVSDAYVLDVACGADVLGDAH